MLRAAAALAALTAAVWAGGCRNTGSPSAPGGPDEISIASITPPDGTTLAAGSSVTFSAFLVYLLNSSGAATITLVAEDQDNRVLNANNQVTTVVSQGNGSVVLSGRVAIPAAGVSLVRVTFPMAPTTAFSIPPMAAASYPVAPPAHRPLRP
jgi:hypothetical protein